MSGNRPWSKVPVLLLFALGLVVAPAFAQSPTGSIAGRVTDPNGAVVANASVTIESPSLQGTQQATTSPYGDYIFKWLPPGEVHNHGPSRGICPAEAHRDGDVGRTR